jgi:ElaB/YqjD/DUF883 family membrane-anchored ribosome-binding protein
MNAKQRAELSKIVSELEALLSRLETVHEEETEKLSNMEEKLGQTERYQTMEEEAGYIESAKDNVQTALDDLGNLSL